MACAIFIHYRVNCYCDTCAPHRRSVRTRTAESVAQTAEEDNHTHIIIYNIYIEVTHVWGR